MSTSTIRKIYSPSSAPTRGLLRRAWSESRALTLLIGLNLAALALAVIGLVIDPRLVLGAAAYLGFTLLTLWQAQRNQSIIAPDALTLGALAALLAVSGAAAWAITRVNQRKPV